MTRKERAAEREEKKHHHHQSQKNQTNLDDDEPGVIVHAETRLHEAAAAERFLEHEPRHLGDEVMRRARRGAELVSHLSVNGRVRR